jgi:hypothetical protein
MANVTPAGSALDAFAAAVDDEPFVPAAGVAAVLGDLWHAASDRAANSATAEWAIDLCVIPELGGREESVKRPERNRRDVCTGTYKSRG